MTVNLFCFPFAGGSKYSYNSYARLAGKNIKMIPLDYPGRGFRIRETLLTVIGLIVDDCFEMIKDRLETPYALYGHSMGTIVSYLLTKRIIKEGLAPPVYLFLSGRGGPSVTYAGTAKHLLPSAQFKEALKKMGGNSDEVLNDRELMDFFEPILRADFEALENYRYEIAEPFDIPITVMIGEQEGITPEVANAWQMRDQVKGRHKKIYRQPLFYISTC